MLIAVHTVAGVIIAKKITTSALGAFIVGTIFHFVLDFIPHGDKKLLHWFSRKINRDLVLSITIMDAFITIIYLLYIFVYTTVPDYNHIFWAILGSILPDFLNTYYQIFKPKILKIYGDFHEHIHDYVPSKMTVKEGLVLQFLLIIILIYIAI